MLESKNFHSIPRQVPTVSTPTSNTHYSSISKAFAVKEVSTDSKFSFLANSKKQSLDAVSNGSNSTTSSLSNITTIKTDFQTKEKNYQNTIDKLQKKIETLTLENKKLSENIQTKNSVVINKAEDSSFIAQEEKEKAIEMRIRALNQENSSLSQQLTIKRNEFGELEKKLESLARELREKDEQAKKFAVENNNLNEKLKEKEKKLDDLDEMYKQKLSQIKKEVSFIKEQQKETSPKDSKESTQYMSQRIKELEDVLRRKNEEINEIKRKSSFINNNNKINPNNNNSEPKTPHNSETFKTHSNKASEFSISGTLNRDCSRPSLIQGLIKCNWEEMEKKLIKLIEENEKLNDNLLNNNNDQVNWCQKYKEMEQRFYQIQTKGGVSNEFFAKLQQENDELRKNIQELLQDKAKNSEKISVLQQEIEFSSKTSQETLKKQEKELKSNYENTISMLEEQKEKNLLKISKENHELKQHNDELRQQLELLQQRQNDNLNNIPAKKANEKQPLAQNSSPILIINEMLTPSAKNLLEKTQKESNKIGNLATITENKDENVFIFSKNKRISNENLKKNLNLCNNANESNRNSGIKTHNSRESQEFPAKFLTKNYIVPNNANNNSMKENNNSKEVSFKENNLKESNISFKDMISEKSEVKTETNTAKNIEKFDFSQQKHTNYLPTGKQHENPLKKETKVISFNLLDSKGKTEITSMNNSNNNNYNSSNGFSTAFSSARNPKV